MLKEQLSNKKQLSMKTRGVLLLVILAGMKINFSLGQEILGKPEAVSIALENNFDIRTSENDKIISGNNASIKNSGYLPTVSARGNATYAVTDNHQVGDAGSRDLNGVATTRLSSDVTLNYTVFDGWGRQYNYKILQENFKLTELQARQVIENSLINIFSSYYEIARLTHNVQNQKETLDVSRKRWQRAKYSFDYGQNTQLDVLNAEVDYNTDSINYLTNTQLLENEKRNLNLILGRDIGVIFAVDTTIQYTAGLQLNDLMVAAENNNVRVLQSATSLTNAEYNIKFNNAANIPKLGLNAGYSWSHNDLGGTGLFNKMTQKGPSIGASITWNIFDGGATNVRKQNSKVAYQNQKISMERVEMEVKRDVANAWTVYQTALFVLKAEQKNVETNQRNFDRTVEQYALGQITSIVFRQAQINLLNAQLSLSQAKYSAKSAELVLLQLSGELMNAQF